MALTQNKLAEYYQVYVWQLPVRFYHWINALCILVLATTGFFIGRPLAIHSGAEASNQYLFGTIRFLHFMFAFIFFFNFLFRIYWGFVGNRYAGWKNFIPYTREHWKEIFHVLCLDILMICKQPLKSIGHNAMAGFTYFITFLVFLFQALTGFGLYSAMSQSWFPKLFAWIVPLMGGDFAVRQWHHMMMWVFIVFAIVHIYLVFYHDYIEERGTTSSMVGGWKFIEKDELNSKNGK